MRNISHLVLQEVIRITALNFKVSNLVGLFRKFILLKVFSQTDILQLLGYVCKAVQVFVCADVLRQAQV